MTLPYSRFPLERALSGIKVAGYRYVAWGTTMTNPGIGSGPAGDAPPDRPRNWARGAAISVWSRDDVLGTLRRKPSRIFKRTHPAGRGGGSPSDAHLRPHQGRQSENSGSSASSNSAPWPATMA